MLRRNSLPLVALITAVAAGCASEVNDLKTSKGTKAIDRTEPEGRSERSNAPAVASTPGTTRTPLADQIPIKGNVLSSPREVLTSAAFTATAPSVRANDRHSAPVTGKDCMTCHGTGGSAPHFAYGGTIALGKNWVVGTPAWTQTPSSTGSQPNEYADEYGDYFDDDYGYGGGDDYGYCPQSDYDAYSDYGSYDDYGSGGSGGYDDYDYGGGGGCGKRGWPEDRTNPSQQTDVRIVGANGDVFDAITDEDGNFWFKSKEDVAVPAFTGLAYGAFTVTGSTNGIACGSCHESGAADSPGRLWTWDGPTPR